MALSEDGSLVGPPVPPSTQMLLAVHHGRHRQLLRPFLAWKRCAQAQRERRKQVAAACRVGAVFCQRVFWEKWRVFVDKKRQQRPEEEAPRLLQGEKVASLEDESLSNIKIIGDLEERTVENVSDGEEGGDQHGGGAAILLRKRRYFKRWNLAVKVDGRDTGSWGNGVVRIRSLHAIRRWRGFVRLKKDRTVLQQRAYFFLYYWLLKRSLTSLGQHSLIKKRERTLTVKIVKASRRRMLVKMMKIWRMRLRLHQTLALWRSFVRQRRHQALLYRPVADALTRKTHHRLLQLTFGAWEKQHARNEAQHMLVNVIDRQLYRKVCERAWRTWKIKVRQIIQLDTFQRSYQERRLRRFWEAWSVRTREKGRQEQLRRLAVRACYLSLLRKGFTGFRACRDQRQLRLNRVETMQDAADARLMTSAFSHWDHFTSKKKTRALKCQRALLHSESRLLQRVWANGFRCFFSRALTKRRLQLAALEQYTTRAVRHSFRMWKDEWQAERSRDDVLNNMLQDYMLAKHRTIKCGVLENWSEFARAKAANRVVNVQVRGLAQRRILRKHLSQWITYISLLRWQQITRARAEQHYKGVILRKCLERWQHNIILRRRYRKKTRTALVHWKLVLQCKVFDGWKQYLQSKRAKQQRIHEALEFRHQQFVRNGLHHWITAAMNLQERREQQVARAQASSTTQVWHRVAAIARHWRYLAIRRRTIRDQAQAPENPRSAFRPQEDEYWPSERQRTARAQDMQPMLLPPDGTSKLRRGNMLSTAVEYSNRANERSPLSEFVLLPRKRPQPRRPVEVLIFANGEADTENLSRANENAYTNSHETVRCGFEFPVEPFAPLSSPPRNQAKPPSSPRTFLPANNDSGRMYSRFSAPVMPPREDSTLCLPSTTAKRLDALERQLLALCQRKKVWKGFQRQLNALREEADRDPRIQSKLRLVEEQHAVRTNQWLRTKGRIRSLATQIQELRSALQR